MKKVLRSASALAAIMVAAPVAAHATDGWYGRADVGYSFAGKFDIDNGDSFDHKDDWTEHLGIGYGFANGFRLEGEVAHRFNREEDDDDPTVNASTHVWTAMLNGYYDFNKGGRFQPYLGAGVGIGRVLLSAHDTAGTAFHDIDNRFAYQGLAGVGIVLNPQLTLDIGYRYLRIDNLKFDGTATSGTVVSPIALKGDYDQHAATVGLRWQFAAAAAPPPPPPPPPPVAAAPAVQVCPAQDFKVYFEWDRSNLNAAANDTINAAVERAKACNVSTVRVVGYTDTSGSAKYNLALSNRRAAVVRDALVAGGIPATLVTTEGLGETNLDKPTKDGVREPLNRRTAVTISFQ